MSTTASLIAQDMEWERRGFWFFFFFNETLPRICISNKQLADLFILSVHVVGQLEEKKICQEIIS